MLFNIVVAADKLVPIGSHKDTPDTASDYNSADDSYAQSDDYAIDGGKADETAPPALELKHSAASSKQSTPRAAHDDATGHGVHADADVTKLSEVSPGDDCGYESDTKVAEHALAPESHVLTSQNGDEYVSNDDYESHEDVDGRVEDARADTKETLPSHCDAPGNAETRTQHSGEMLERTPASM